MEASSSTDASHEGHIALDVGIGNETLLAKISVIDVCLWVFMCVLQLRYNITRHKGMVRMMLRFCLVKRMHLHHHHHHQVRRRRRHHQVSHLHNAA